MKRFNQFVMCLLASMLVLNVSAQDEKPFLKTQPVGFVQTNLLGHTVVSVYHRGVKDIKWKAENLTVEPMDKSKMNAFNAPSISNRGGVVDTQKTPSENIYSLYAKEYGPGRVEFTGVTDSGEVLKSSLMFGVGDGLNDNLKLKTPEQIVKDGDSHTLKLKIDRDVKRVLVYVNGQDKYYYQKVSGRRAKIKLDLSDVTKNTLIFVLAYDAQYKSKYVYVKLNVK